MLLLTEENYKKCFLMDDEVIGGVAEHPEQPGKFVAFVLQNATGEYLGYHLFDTVQEALDIINRLERAWIFEPLSNCSGGCHSHDHGEGEEHGHGHGNEPGHDHGSGGCGGCGGHGGCGGDEH